MSTSGQHKFATICSANVNRSMAGHDILKKNGFNVRSFGTGTKGKSGQLSFDFGTPYKDIYDYMMNSDKAWFQQRGLLDMIIRDKNIKEAPQRWQDCDYVTDFDVVICCAKNSFTIVLDGILFDYNRIDLQTRDLHVEDSKTIHVVCYDIEDKPEIADKSAENILKFCQMCNEKETLDEIDSILSNFEEETGIALEYSPFYP